MKTDVIVKILTTQLKSPKTSISLAGYKQWSYLPEKALSVLINNIIHAYT